MNAATRICLALATAAFLLTACAPAMRWDKAAASDDDIALAIQDCNAAVAAELRSERIFRQESLHSRAIDPMRTDQAAVERRFQEADYRRLKNRLFNDCMTAKGYQRLPADAPKPKPAKPSPAPFAT